MNPIVFKNQGSVERDDCSQSISSRVLGSIGGFKILIPDGLSSLGSGQLQITLLYSRTLTGLRGA
ncbi:hypothetical protein, partial [Gorillibacterium sp. sgz5001074]|uniref:hypothetical protein n=1 Tax=Gorillibacterium sp. sgz5001074 TaxID=3446695 RepID=UPI003F674C9E